MPVYIVISPAVIANRLSRVCSDYGRWN